MGEIAPARGARPLADLVAAELRARIARGELQPGDRLPSERALAESLGVHRGSLREALRQLERLRLVVTRPGSGTRVLDPQHASFELAGERLAGEGDGARLRDLLAVREHLTSGALRELAERRAGGSLRELVATLDAVAASDLPGPAFVEALWELPASLARAAGNGVLVLLANSVTRFLGLGAAAAWAQEIGGADRRALAAALRRMARALEARDPERAQRAARELNRRLAACAFAVPAPRASS